MRKILIMASILGMSLVSANNCQAPENVPFTLDDYKKASKEERYDYKEMVEVLEMERKLFEECVKSEMGLKNSNPIVIMAGAIEQTRGNITLDRIKQMDTEIRIKEDVGSKNGKNI